MGKRNRIKKPDRVENNRIAPTIEAAAERFIVEIAGKHEVSQAEARGALGRALTCGVLDADIMEVVEIILAVDRIDGAE